MRLHIWKVLTDFIALVRQLDLYNYPSVLTLLARDNYRWLGSLRQVQTVYNSSMEKISSILNSPLASLLNIEEEEKHKSLKLNIKETAYELKFPDIFLPNISNYKVILGPLCWIYALFGYSKRIKNVNLFRNYKNGKANRKLFFMFYSLHQLKINKRYSDYWALCNIILKDKDYLIANFHKTHPRWYKSMKLQDVLSILKEIELIVNTPNDSILIELKRVYIKKTSDPKDKRVRPLGVPSLAYRVYLCMLNNLITFVRVDNINTLDQHGYLPQKSILTAWKSIFDNLKSYEYIYEFDLSKFFDSVPHSLIDCVLKNEYLMPLELRHRIKKLNESIVKLTSYDKVTEEDRLPLSHGKNVENPNKFYDVSQSFILSRSWTKLCQENKNIPNTQVFEYPSLEELDDLFNPEHDGHVELSNEFVDQPVYEIDIDEREIAVKKEKGVPQGGACSPTLATLCLDPLFKKLKNRNDVRLIMYADDGLIFANNTKTIDEIKEELNKIVAVNNEKSSYFKNSGGYCKQLKFCGLLFDPVKYTLSSLTRFGAKLDFGPCEQFLSYLKLNCFVGYNKIVENVSSDVSVKEFLELGLERFNLLNLHDKITLFFNPAVSGYFLNCLYLGSYKFQIKDKNYFYEGKKESWLNTRSSYVLWQIKNEQSNVIENLVSMEIEWICYNILSTQSNWNIFNFVSRNDDNLYSMISSYVLSLSNCSASLKVRWSDIQAIDFQLSLFIKDYIPRSFNLKITEMLERLIILIKLKEQIYLGLISFRERSLILGEFFSINKYNCSSLAINDLKNLMYSKNAVFSKYRFSFPKYKEAKNSKTLLLKESKFLRIERKMMYPAKVEQGLIK